ncbi:DNA-binding transcriptional regulator, XRE-family HTH domain [Saccharicrinis carchari]|uniref:DNA-binding transcriptional regulator, XRE-family HTH domain n=1 Tax=Saccharicrinis carchari TaxID=1168039 RepID=A0A521F3X3_SACCC|nr:helix-turn-helix transcriptional regulator [Saccharicrinis carchari]SMO90854.1 DNA-binding transcriptional regulator, XRE-family HTH domain [Saccharicrinis carchari]
MGEQTNKKPGAETKRPRIAKGMAQLQLGEAISTKQANISQLEKGKLNPSVEDFEKVAPVLGIEAKELFENMKLHSQA